VCDVDRGNARLIVDPANFFPQAGSQLCIEGGKRFIEKQYFRFRGQRPCQGDALTFAAAQAGAFPFLISLKIHQLKEFLDRLDPLPLLQLQVFQGIGDVLFHIHMGEKGVILKDHSDLSLVHLFLADIFATENDRSGLGVDEAGDHAQCRGFAAS
jgi:hypothetical protein